MEKKILNIGLNQEYSDAYSIICHHRSNALMAVNVEHLLMCWELGGYISFRIKHGKWGDGIVQGFADFVHQQIPSMKGFSKRNLYNMVRFYDSFSSVLFLQESTKYQLDAFVQPPAAQIAEQTVVEYALSRSMSPTMVAEYKSRMIPQEVLQKTLNEYIELKK